ncbi:imelysin family protein [Chitinimonas sp. BJYL2]|uniref:imelysin family protein n=1 Tax=Chitinimonas sp. BJYL2 TaxID=2976696 RepID=UPI0022B5BEB5|nr:imelysin family protein [Chitinimonas sp. BJYL2]
MMIRPLLPGLLLAIFATFGQASPLDHAAVLDSWRQQQTPRITALAEQGQDLQQKLDALCQRKNAANLDAARQAWRQVWLTWRAVEALPLGPVMSRRTAWQMDVWPTRTPKVEEAVRLVKHDAAIADSVGAASQGLPALEYLLWGDDRPHAQLGRLVFRQRCEYAMALGQDIAAETAGLRAEWMQQNASTNTQPAPQQFEEAFNLLANSLDQLRDKKLARIGNPKIKNPARQDVDGWRSRSTRQGLQATTDALEGLIFNPANGQSLASWLTNTGRPMTVQQLRREFALARTLIARLPDDASSWLISHRSHAQALAESFRRIQNLIEIEVADAVGVTIGFKDSDGD